MEKNKNIKKKEKEKKKFKISIFVIIVIVVVGFMSIFITYETLSFKNDIKELVEKDPLENEYDTNSTRHLVYKKPEICIKLYFQKQSEKLKEIESIKNDKALKNYLSASNYLADGPLFTKTIDELNSLKDKITKSNEELQRYDSDETRNEIAENENLNFISKKIYFKNINSEIINEKTKKNIENANATTESTKNLIEKELKVLEFLKSTPSWTVKNERVIFFREEDLNTYNTLIKDIA